MSFKCQRSFSGGKVTNWRGMINGCPAGGRTECSDYLLLRWARSLYVRRWHDLIDLQRQDICCSSHKFYVPHRFGSATDKKCCLEITRKYIDNYTRVILVVEALDKKVKLSWTSSKFWLYYTNDLSFYKRENMSSVCMSICLCVVRHFIIPKLLNR